MQRVSCQHSAAVLRETGLRPILTFLPDFRILPVAKTMFLVCLNGRVTVSPETRFPIHYSFEEG